MKRRIEIVKQTSAKDCGPASLLSVIKYYGGYVPLERIKLDTKTSKDGTNLYDMKKAANEYGFDACGYKLKEEDLFDEKRMFPAIVHIEVKGYLHYVVLYQLSSTKALIMDPAVGKKYIDVEEFLEQWTGYVLEFYPRRNIVIMDKKNKLLDMISIIFSKEKIILQKIFICSLLYALFSVILSYYFKVGIEFLESYLDTFKFILIMFFLVVILKCVFYNLKIKFITYFNKNLDVRLFSEFIHHLFVIPSKVLSTKSLGEIVTRLNDLKNVKQFISEFIVTVFLDFLIMLLAVPILMYINTQLFVILLVMLIIYLIVGTFFSKIMVKKLLENIEFETKFNVTLLENLNMHLNIKHLNKTREVLKKLEVSLSNYFYNSLKVCNLSNFQTALKFSLTELTFYLINTIGFYLILISKLSLVDLITFNTIVSFFLEPIKNLMENIPKYNFVKASIYKLKEFLNVDAENVGRSEVIDNFNIRYENITFSYNGLTDILRSFDCEIKSNEHALVKGKSGSGKSTLCKLLLKEEFAQSGELYIGDNNIKDLSLKTLRENIVFVSQKEFLYTDTIKNNIVFYSDYETSKFNEICKICKLEEIIDNKPMRYESLLDTEFNNLSGGEKQRIILARACYKNFNVLIIDEALSEVDLETEIEIIKNLKKYFKDKMILYISHKNVSKCFKKVINV